MKKKQGKPIYTKESYNQNTYQLIEEKLEKRLINQIIKWITEGMNKGEIIEKITMRLKADKNAEKLSHHLIAKAIFQLTEFSNSDPSETIKAHLEIYESIYDYFKSIKNIQGANKALRAKEKLKGIIQNQRVVINQNTVTEISVNPQYDISRLTDEEQKRMNYLLNKARIN